MEAARRIAEPLPADLLIVDDDADLIDLIRELLEAEGYRVLTAANGREGLNLLAEGPLPRMLLVDLHMPVMTGWEMLEAMALDPRLQRLSTVVMSAEPGLMSQAGTAHDFPGTPVVAVLPKPLLPDAVLAKVRAHLSGLDGAVRSSRASWSPRPKLAAGASACKARLPPS